MLSSSTLRVLVVDDSALMRRMLSDIINAAPGLEVVGTAEDGERALTLVGALKPDVITLDIQMPKLDGIETLTRLLALAPIPVVMVSSLTKLGAEITLTALDLGAIDFVAKPEGTRALGEGFAEELVKKIRIASMADVARQLSLRQMRRRLQTAPGSAKPANLAAGNLESARSLVDKCVAIGISTGGPPALAVLFEALQGPLPPVFVVQHMPPMFTKAFADRLNGLSQLTVKEAESGETPVPNHVYIAPGGRQMEVTRSGSGARIAVRDGESVSGHRPSVDAFMFSAVKVYGSSILGVIMTGMGRDGADGCAAVRRAGGYVLGQDADSSDVYGMNKIAFQEGAVDRQFELSQGAVQIRREVRRLWGNTVVNA